MVAASEAQAKGFDEARKLTYVHLYDHLQAVKDKINKQRGNWPATGVRDLPATPNVLCHRHPDLYREVLDGKALVPCPAYKLVCSTHTSIRVFFMPWVLHRDNDEHEKFWLPNGASIQSGCDSKPSPHVACIAA